MARLDKMDLKLTEDGDLVIEERDLATVIKQDFISQSARTRIKVSDPEWYDHQMESIGANLEDLIGMPNSPETAELGVERIGEALTRGGLLDSEDIYIRPVPVSRYYIVFYTFIRTTENGEPLGFEVLFNLQSGLELRSV